MEGDSASRDVRKFACVSCGKCCDRGPEMELGEAAALADVFSLSLIFKIHSLPLNEKSSWARAWWKAQDTPLGLRPALEEQARRLKFFAARRHVDRTTERQVFLTLSAIVDDDGAGRCPALSGNRCGIYERRPLTCRTVPLHYSRPPSTLGVYLDRFVATPGYDCETASAPVVLAGAEILADTVRHAREQAVLVARHDRDLKTAIVALMENPQSACDAGLPTFADVLANSDRGYATTAPMLVAWRVALRKGFLDQTTFDNACRGQAALLEAARAKPGCAAAVNENLSLYRSALLKVRPSTGASLLLSS